MARYKLTIEYDGSPFQGWQAQENGPSVQSAIEAAIFAFCGEETRVHGAGRTDAGVHALAQVAHIDIAKETDAEVLCGALNFHLVPQPVAILKAEKVSDDFHARFSATARHYRYVIVNRRARLALEGRRAWQVTRPLNVTAMQEGARFLLGKHDFTTFRSSRCQASSALKTLDRLDVTGAGEEIIIETSARSFLHNQVRSMVGSLALVGEGKWESHMMRDALAACNRAACGPVAPPQGLYLVGVDYVNDANNKSNGAEDNDDEA